MRWRKHAQRLLVESGDQGAVDGLIALVEDSSTDEIGLNPGAIHALWALHGLGALDQPAGEAFQAAVAALNHPSAGVRSNSVQVLPAAEESVEAILDAGLLEDSDGDEIGRASCRASAEVARGGWS